MSLRLARLALATAVLLLPSCKDKVSATHQAQRAGETLAGATRAQLGELLSIGTPHRCAAVRNQNLPTLTIAPDAERATVVVVAGLRDLNQGTRESLDRLSAAIEKTDPTAVISLGGHSDAVLVLSALIAATGHKTRPLIMVPGTVESIDNHRAAIAAASDLNVIDGAEIRHINLGPMTVLTVPGADSPRRHAAQSQGCVFTAGDIEDALALVTSTDRVLVLAAAMPPRQTGETATDLVDGVHIGSIPLATAALKKNGGAHAVVHGVSGRPTSARYPIRGLGHPVMVPSGSLETSLRAQLGGDFPGASAVVLTASATELRVRALFGTVP